MFAAAAALGLPVAAIIWFEVSYLWFGLYSTDPPAAVEWLIAGTSYAGVLAYSMFNTRGAAEAAVRACRLGIGVSILLPVVCVAVLLLWVNGAARPDLGMGGLALYAIPVVAFGLSIVLVVVFGTGRWLASKRLRVQPHVQ